MQSEPPFAIRVPQDSPANSSIKHSFLGQMSPLVQQTLAGWRHGERSSVPTSRADAMVDDIARARIQNRAQRGQRAAFEVPGSGGNRPRAPQKWRPKVTFSLSRMYPSSPRAKKTTPSSFLASEWRANNGKCSKTDAENEDQMSGKGSIESPGRIDTSDVSVRRKFACLIFGTHTIHVTSTQVQSLSIPVTSFLGHRCLVSSVGRQGSAVRSRPILSSDRPLRHEKPGPLARSCGLNGCHKGCLRMENDCTPLTSSG